VLDARNNLANQEVFSIARQVDPDGMRTLGVMTKLDAIQSGDEYEVFMLVDDQIQASDPIRPLGLPRITHNN
jgi:hypothetical protein